jgi:hypothetical protein
LTKGLTLAIGNVAQEGTGDADTALGSNFTSLGAFPMNKYVRLFFFSALFFVFSNVGLAAIPTVTGTYEVTNAKYIAPTLASCASVTITVKITRQCGRLLKGSITVAGVTIPVVGKLQADNKTILFQGAKDTASSYQYIILHGEYQASPKSIKVGAIGSVAISSDSLPDDTEFDDFVLTLKP